MKTTSNSNIGELVAIDYRTSEVFSKYDIDFCCNGNRTILEACSEKNLKPEEVIKEIDDILAKNSGQKIDFDSFPIDLLSQYIELKHHKYVERQIPLIKGYLKKIIAAHGNRHPELHDILELFETGASKLTLHMKREELTLFPQIIKMHNAVKEGKAIEEPPFGSFKSPIENLLKEHQNEGVRFKKIRELSNDFEVPADGCGTYKVTYKLLEEFEEDLHLHIHLENNILFPKAMIKEIHNN